MLEELGDSAIPANPENNRRLLRGWVDGQEKIKDPGKLQRRWDDVIDAGQRMLRERLKNLPAIVSVISLLSFTPDIIAGVSSPDPMQKADFLAFYRQYQRTLDDAIGGNRDPNVMAHLVKKMVTYMRGIHLPDDLVDKFALTQEWIVDRYAAGGKR